MPDDTFIPPDAATKRRCLTALTGCFGIAFAFMFFLTLFVISFIRWRFPDFTDNNDDAIAVAITIATGLITTIFFIWESSRQLEVELSELRELWQTSGARIAALTVECASLKIQLAQLEAAERARQERLIPTVGRWLRSRVRP